MRVISWNIQKQKGLPLDGAIAVLRAIEPDLLLLQEVTRVSLDTLAVARTLGLTHVASAIEEAQAAGKYAASVIVSRWPLARVPSGWARAPLKGNPALAGYKRMFPGWDGTAPRPWLLVRATVKAPSGTIDVINAHVPESSKNSWDKVKTFIALGAAAAGAPAGPRIVGGDLEAPRLETPERVVCFSPAKGRGPLWEQAGRSVIRGMPLLRDVFRAHHGYEAEAARDAYSYVAGTAKRRYDHLFASPELRTASVEYRTDWLLARLSAHAPIVADLFWASGAEA